MMHMAQRIPELEPVSETREAPVRPSEGSSDCSAVPPEQHEPSGFERLMCVPRAARALRVALVAASVLLRALSVEGMRDPHVVELRYRLKTEETVTFDNPPLLERDGGILCARCQR